MNASSLVGTVLMPNNILLAHMRWVGVKRPYQRTTCKPLGGMFDSNDSTKRSVVTVRRLVDLVVTLASDHHSIIDNRYGTPGNTTVEYTITWEAEESDPVLMHLIVITIIVIIMVVIVLAWAVVRTGARMRTGTEAAAREEPQVSGGPPAPPRPYADWVVERSELELGHELDPERDGPS